ncbi:C-type lectin lectoxin-Lio2-like isoform X2 [Saccostrea cucullata]|uniref:C-type lectin lectoxin-Lio2-like isoform X1 n=1 Tax=Saccostrea cuccullata TaxID=36930 RepID=UPI002ED6291B
MISVIALFVCLNWIALSLSTSSVLGCDFKSEKNLMKNISDLQLQLFSSMQKRMTYMKSAVFETQCKSTGCTFNGHDSADKTKNVGQLRVFKELKAIRKEISGLGKQKSEIKVCQNGWRKFRNHCYAFFPEKRNWFEAHMSCRQHGAKLVHIGDGVENKWIASQYKTRSIWVDATDIAKEGQWKSFSNGKATYTNWSKGNPGRNSQHCATINWAGSGLWDDDHCINGLTFICEQSGTEC